MILREHRPYDVADDGDRSLQLGLGIGASLAGDRRQLGDRPAALQNHQPFAGLVDAVQDGGGTAP